MAHEIQDFGEKIGGAKKDLWRTRGMIVADLDDINDMELEEFVKKDNIWVVKDWAELAGTKPGEVLYYIKLMRDKIPAKFTPSTRSSEKNRQRAEAYIEFVRNVKEYSDNHINTVEDIREFFKNFATQYGYLDGRRWTEKAMLVDAFGTTWVNFAQPSSYALEKIVAEARIQHFPEQFRGDLKGVYYSETSRGYALWKNGTCIARGVYFETPEQAIEYCDNELRKSLDEQRETQAVTKKGNIKVVRPQLGHISRTGGDIRKGQNCSSDILLEHFKFRGGEFGNWNNDKDRQDCLNYAFDAFCDLLYVLDLPLEAIGL